MEDLRLWIPRYISYLVQSKSFGVALPGRRLERYRSTIARIASSIWAGESRYCIGTVGDNVRSHFELEDRNPGHVICEETRHKYQTSCETARP
jgi:hypothetical protein